MPQKPIIIICAFNEQNWIGRTIDLIKATKVEAEIIVVNDGSTDKTADVLAKYFINFKNLRIINQKNSGKAGALNTALRYAKGEYFGVFDADSVANKKALKLMLPYFTDDKIGAVISPIKVYDPKNVIEKMQRLEYIFSSFIRRLMSSVNTLHITHGVLTLFRTDVLIKLKGFDDKHNKNLTEDLEIALRLRKNHYQILLCEENVNYTRVPRTFKSLWLQRVRWFRGFIVNNFKYKDMVMRKRYGLLGRFQIPLELLTVLIVFISVGFMGYQFIIWIYRFFLKIYTMGFEIFEVFRIPTIKQFLLGVNFNLAFPFIIVLIAGLYLYFMAHRYVGEKWKFHLVSFIYLFLYPVVRSIQWIHAFVLEIAGAKQRWR